MRHTTITTQGGVSECTKGASRRRRRRRPILHNVHKADRGEHRTGEHKEKKVSAREREIHKPATTGKI